jgi:hypothetical protein
MFRQFIAAATLVAAFATASLTGCVGGGDAEPSQLAFAGYVENTLNPEDMVLIPETPWVVASTDQTPGKPKPAYLYLIDSRTKTADVISAKVASTSSAGDPSCTPIPLANMALNGLGLATGAGGTYQLMAVNRGERMSIEFFDIELSGSAPVFTWVGCLIMPAKAFPNDVVSTGDGGLAVTVSFETDTTGLIEQLENRKLTGYVLEWNRQQGFVRVPGSELSFNNGLEFDPITRSYYLAGWGSKSLLRVPASSGGGQPLLAQLDIRPDNMTWSKAGTLIIAGHTQSPTEVFGCVPTGADICPVPFKVIEVNPQTLSVIRVLVDGESMKDYAGATTGLEVGDELWVSSFRYNKIARYRN